MMQIDILSFKYQANLTYFDRKNIVHIEIQTLKPALIADIARLAEVGTATVDRVSNGPASVRPATRQLILQAKAATENGTFVIGSDKPWRLKVFFPGDAACRQNTWLSAFKNLVHAATPTPIPNP